MARLVDYLIDDIRSHTENEDFSDTIGIKDIEFLRFINDAQFRIHSLITQQHPQVFLEEKEVSIVADQEAYTLPYNVFLGNKVSAVEYSATSLAKDYYPLRPASLRNRWGGSEGDPIFYIRKSGTILLNPIPQSSAGKLRYTYIKNIPKLDVRRGSVSSVTLDTSALTITALTLNVSTDTVDSDALDKETRFCVVDEEGTIKMKNVKFTAVNASTGVVTIDSSFVYESGETIEAGDYIVAGPYSTTHTILDDSIERYIIAYTTMKILQRDSNINDLQTQAAVLRNMEQEIVAAHSEMSDDLIEIPEIISEDDQWSW